MFEVMTTSQDWWPADYGHYGPLFIRLSWHAAGTYRIADGRGGGFSTGVSGFCTAPTAGRTTPAWTRLAGCCGRSSRSTAAGSPGPDLIIFAGNCAMESMGFKTFGFGFGREDIFEPEEIYWGSEHTWLGDERYSGDRELSGPLGAVQMGLIYVNPEGPNGNPDPLAAAKDIRETFARMAMNDEETAALIVGGHTFGKTHGAADPDKIGPEPEGAPIEQQQLGWKNPEGTGVGEYALTSGLEGAWTNNPTRWDNGFLENLFQYEWELTESPAGAKQWKPKNPEAEGTVPDAHNPDQRHAPMMLTTDLALKLDPIYGPICRGFYEHPEQLADAFARAWYKLIHRDMGPVERLIGPWVADAAGVAGPGGRSRPSAGGRAGHRLAQAGHTGFRAVNLAAGVHRLGGRGVLPWHRQAGRRERARVFAWSRRGDWRVNNPPELATVLSALEGIQGEFNDTQSGKARRSPWPT